MAQQGQKLPVVEKVGYAMGDTSANLMFQTMVILQLAFYTDTFGITAAAAGTMLLGFIVLFGGRRREGRP